MGSNLPAQSQVKSITADRLYMIHIQLAGYLLHLIPLVLTLTLSISRAVFGSRVSVSMLDVHHGLHGSMSRKITRRIEGEKCVAVLNQGKARAYCTPGQLFYYTAYLTQSGMDWQ